MAERNIRSKSLGFLDHQPGAFARFEADANMPIRSLANLLNTYLVPQLAIKPVAGGAGLKLSDIFDGLVLVQKRKKNIRTKWREMYGNDNWMSGTKLWKPKKNLTSCPECGSFHEFHAICRECFNKVNNIQKKTKEELVESENTKSWFEPNVAQVKNPASRDEPNVVKEV